jgi:hypothetical protein
MSWESIYECALNSGLIKKPLERGFLEEVVPLGIEPSTY